MIRDANELEKREIEIDLTGPAGNAFALLGTAMSLCSQTDVDWKELEERMTSGDYDNLVEEFDKSFGDFVTLYR